MTLYMYRRGNGNEGNFLQHVVSLAPTDDPYAALRVLVPNDYIARTRTRTRNHITRNIDIDGDAEHTIYATVYEGPDGQTEFGAAWLTAELQAITADEAAYYEDRGMAAKPLRKLLDRGALALYRKLTKEG